MFPTGLDGAACSRPAVQDDLIRISGPRLFLTVGQLALLFAGFVVVIGLWARRNRAMARVMEEGENEGPVSPCTVPGAESLYDELRWLRQQLEADDDPAPFGEGARVGASVGASGSVGIYISTATTDTAGADQRRAHAAQLRQALSTLPLEARQALSARGVEPELSSLPERAERSMDRNDAVRMAGEVRRFELALSQAS